MNSTFKVLALVAVLTSGVYSLAQDNKPTKPRYEQVKRKSFDKKKFKAITNDKHSKSLERDTINAKIK